MNLLHRIETHCRKHGIAESRFGRNSIKDPCLVHDLRLGRSPTGRTVAKVVAFMEGRA